MDKKSEEIKINKFSKNQITNSKKYRKRRDLLNAILDKSKHYSMDEVDRLIEKFMKGEVK
ncbi:MULTISPECIES: hypothetical protein [Clostridia]|uniref:hypothetical protein n=1 Tax=Clostridium sp. CCUG 7971 TaxID=2811414 RepID=UPI001ABA5F2E|nr:hypothetical protein [Clostridium sp. CCUG 7971]MBO3444018.1 hypothetical protein [Clostridium sp. CCUG 7971]